jgi:hypothetical protein
MTPRVLLGHAVAAAAALLLSVRHARRLGISGTEAWRYFKKSTSLGLCLAGICPAATLRQVWLAGKAAFVCCAYDVVTDWRSFHPRDFEAFLATLRVEQIDPALSAIAIALYEKKKNGRIARDGLERGSVALRGVLTTMGCQDRCMFPWYDVDRVGELIQLVDDVLDYEDDTRNAELNCLHSPRRLEYLAAIQTDLDETAVERLFGSPRSILAVVIRRARDKAGRMLAMERTEASPRGLFLSADHSFRRMSIGRVSRRR